MSDLHTVTRADLMRRLRLINQALERLEADPFVTMIEAQALPDDNLAGMVAASADHLVRVARAVAPS